MRARRPSLYDEGTDPDYRFTLANERTFLAWVRTALALDAAGLALVALLPPFAVPGAREVLGTALVALGTLAAATAHRRWRGYDAALRAGAPLPPSRLPLVLAVGVAVVAVLTVLLLVAGAAGP